MRVSLIVWLLALLILAGCKGEENEPNPDEPLAEVDLEVVAILISDQVYVSLPRIDFESLETNVADSIMLENELFDGVKGNFVFSGLVKAEKKFTCYEQGGCSSGRYTIWKNGHMELFDFSTFSNTPNDQYHLKMEYPIISGVLDVDGVIGYGIDSNQTRWPNYPVTIKGVVEVAGTPHAGTYTIEWNYFEDTSRHFYGTITDQNGREVSLSDLYTICPGPYC